MPDKRGLLLPEELAAIRKARVGEQWERIDSIVIGPGARDVEVGWFNTWAEFAAADELTLFQGRSGNSGKSLVNQRSERTDWAQTIHQTLCEYRAPVGISDLETDPNDGFFSPQMFAQMLPDYMPWRVVLAESDDMTLAPGSHYPSGFGPAYSSNDGAAAPTATPGSQGEPVISQGWKWPEPLQLAAKSSIAVVGSIDQPFRNFLADLPGPGFKEVPDGQGGVVRLPNNYFIRWTHRGPRWLQFRGARSSA